MLSSVTKKLNKNETVSIDMLMRICKVFHCDIGDVCEVILDK
ncbi:MAG: helix-turn-helix domain-containing protein [Firmicutes bacterium]|nr:helix-turn-helix domain-containing protein [Bacillota bacterium]